MTFDELNELKKRFEKQIQINEDNVLEKSLEIVRLTSTYLNIFTKELKIRKQLEVEKDQLYGKLYHHYKFKFNFSLDSQKEIDTYVKADDTYYQKCLDLSNQEVITQFLESILETLNKSGYSIKSYIELLKIKNGLI